MTAALASWLFAATWKGSLLVAFALVVHRVARNRIPSRWLCALLLVAILRLLAPVAPASAFSVFNLVPTAAPEPPKEIAVGAPMPRSPRVPVMLRTTAPPPPRRPWLPLLLGVWALGAAIVVSRAVAQTLRFHRRLRGARDVELGELLDECREVLHIRRTVRVAETDAVAAPSLHGWLRPTLLLPEGFLQSFTREQLRYAVLHELAHLRRSDVLVNWIATAAAALHWFNPLVRLALARLAEERELACDALALAALRAEERPAYGGTVLEIVDRLRQTHLVPALVGMTATPAQLKRRIVMIATFKQPRYSILFAALIVAVGLVTLTDAQAHEPQVVRFHKTLSAEAGAVMETLEKPISIDLRSASVADTAAALSTATGVQITIAEGAADPALRLNIKGENLPAHLVIMESLSAAGLAVKITETGVTAFKEPAEGERLLRMGGGEQERVMIRRKSSDEDVAEAERQVSRLRTKSDDPNARRFHIEAEATDDGVTNKRRVTLKDEHGVTTGTLEVEVVK
ncbi:MAG TPA: M56 family metallopeptidase [Thermoanaerobaculia bacterium]|nr:M56 family metallopeptidase [Thermoanaerobaculia bacterium]